VLQGVEFAGKRAIVTGASSGIGLETANGLAAAGVEVTLAVRRGRRATRRPESCTSARMPGWQRAHITSPACALAVRGAAWSSSPPSGTGAPTST
jgi:NAD(P)-dependent dehydrogenase (short-subunit alcohol dehydrogenase family)